MGKITRQPKLTYLSIDPDGMLHAASNVAQSPWLSESTIEDQRDITKVIMGCVRDDPAETFYELLNQVDILGGLLWNYLTDLPNFERKYREHAAGAIIRMATATPSKLCLIKRGDNIIGKFTKLFHGFSALGLAALATMERGGYRYMKFAEYEHLYLGLRLAVEPFLLMDIGPSKTSYGPQTKVVNLVLVHIALHLSNLGVDDSEEIGRHNPELIVLATRLLVGVEGTTKVDDTIGIEGRPSEICIGTIWCLLTALTDSNVSVRDIRNLVDHLSTHGVLLLTLDFLNGRLDHQQIQVASRNAKSLGECTNEDLMNIVAQWSKAERPSNFEQFMKLGGTTQAWQEHLEKKVQREAERVTARKQQRLQQTAKPIPVVDVRARVTTTTGNKRHHRGYVEPTKVSTIDWNSLWNSIREIVPHEHLPNEDPQLVAAILLTLMRSGDRIPERARWPKLKANKLRTRVRGLMDASSREIDSACRRLLEIKLLKQQGRTLLINDRAPKDPRVATVRSQLITLAINTKA